MCYDPSPAGMRRCSTAAQASKTAVPCPFYHSSRKHHCVIACSPVTQTHLVGLPFTHTERHLCDLIRAGGAKGEKQKDTCSRYNSNREHPKW